MTKLLAHPQFKDSGDYIEVISGEPVLVSRLLVDNTTTYIDKDGSNNMTFTDAVTGTKTLAELAAGGGAVATDAIWDAKGDLAVGTGADTASKLTVGANDTMLLADSAQATGLKWGNPATVKTALSLNLVENAAHSTDAHTMTIDGRDVSVDGTKLDGIAAGATVYPDTGEQAFLDADHAKLDAIEPAADVTDATNVAAAGALMVANLENPPTEDEASKAPTSEWAFDHNAAVVSSTVHPNTTMCSAYLAAHQSYIPHAKYARAEIDTATSDAGSNFKHGDVFDQEQADANNCTATNIRDTSVNFQTITGQTNGLRYAKVTWSSDAGGSADTGSGFVTAVTDATNLAIYKTNGANFANSYYYTIKEAWYQAPLTGDYTIKWFIRFSTTNMVADKSYYIIVWVNGGVKAMGCLHSSRAAQLQPFAAAILSLTANDLVTIGTYHDSGADTIQFEETASRTAMHIALLHGA